MTFLILLAAASTAGTSPPQAPAEKEDRMICKAEKFVGSNRTRRVCMTESQWRDGRQNAKDALNVTGRGNSYCQPGPSCKVPF
jgi:hypothetical protein